MTDRNGRYRFVAFVVIAMAVAIWLAGVVGHKITVDSCFDSGGVYLEEIQKCSQSQDEVDRYPTRQD